MLSKCNLVILKHTTQDKVRKRPHVHNYTAREQSAVTPCENGLRAKFEYDTFQYLSVKEDVTRYRTFVNAQWQSRVTLLWVGTTLMDDITF